MSRKSFAWSQHAPWNDGAWTTYESPGRSPKPSAVWSASTKWARCVWQTPLGRPVVPLVYMTTWIPSGSGGGSSAAGSAACEEAVPFVALLAERHDPRRRNRRGGRSPCRVRELGRSQDDGGVEVGEHVAKLIRRAQIAERRQDRIETGAAVVDREVGRRAGADRRHPVSGPHAELPERTRRPRHLLVELAPRPLDSRVDDHACVRALARAATDDGVERRAHSGNAPLPRKLIPIPTWLPPSSGMKPPVR